MALLFILSACGGSAKPERAASHVVRGPGFTFAVLDGWSTRRSASAVVASNGDDEVSARVFPLLKPYDPAKFDAAAKELDRVAERLASAAGGSVTERVTTVVDGRKIRAYRYESNGKRIRIGFVLQGKREYQLLCAGASAGDACRLLYASFSLE